MCRRQAANCAVGGEKPITPITLVGLQGDLIRSSFPARPSARRGHRALVEPHPARLARLPDAEHPSRWLDLQVPHAWLALTVRLLPLAARCRSIPALRGMKGSFSSLLALPG